MAKPASPVNLAITQNLRWRLLILILTEKQIHEYHAQNKSNNSKSDKGEKRVLVTSLVMVEAVIFRVMILLFAKGC
jgi:capsule polysaccharide export protein KpsC/LpsZ